MLEQLAALGYRLNVLPGGFSLSQHRLLGECAVREDGGVAQIEKDAKVIVATTADAFWNK